MYIGLDEEINVRKEQQGEQERLELLDGEEKLKMTLGGKGRARILLLPAKVYTARDKVIKERSTEDKGKNEAHRQGAGDA